MSRTRGRHSLGEFGPCWWAKKDTDSNRQPGYKALNRQRDKR